MLYVCLLLVFLSQKHVSAESALLNKRIALMEDRIENLETANRMKVQQQDAKIMDLEDTVMKLKEEVNYLNIKLEENRSSSSKRLVLDSTEAVAFSTYLDHDLDGVGTQQKITFNQVLYNGGTAYDKVTGVFTCPVSGVYLFIYFIGNRHAGEVDAELVVNGVKQNEAVAEGVQTAHDVQGGNAAILNLNTGDKVWIDTTLGTHVEGQWRFSTFSGALLYPL